MKGAQNMIFKPKNTHILVSAAILALIAGCSSNNVQERSKGHLGLETQQPVRAANIPSAIPPRVKQSVVLPKPKAVKPLEKFTVIVNDVPAKELLFALARDAKMNLDIFDDIEGQITLNAIDQTLPQILNRIGKQSKIRYEIQDDTISVSADTPYLKTYKIDYVNLERKTNSTVELSTQISDASIGDGGGSSGNNNSNVKVENISDNSFWGTLYENISALVGVTAQSKSSSNSRVIVNRETGLITVKASQSEHRDIQNFVEQVMQSARRQVLIEATVVEVNLNDEFQSGIDWSRNPFSVDGNGNPVDDFSFSQQLTGGALSSAPTSVLQLSSVSNSFNIFSTVRLLSKFGDTQVLSSPKMMALNNQTALLKVVDNRVYFTVEANIAAGVNGSAPISTFETDVHTVPVGLVMAITPFISESEEVTLNVRPTISRILGFVNDPNPSLANAGVTSQIPEIQVREMESVLRLNDGQVGVIGGLMQDRSDKQTSAVPGISDVSIVGEAFKAKDNEQVKTELVVFIRPTVIQTPSLEGDLSHLSPYLPQQKQISTQPATQSGSTKN